MYAYKTFLPYASPVPRTNWEEISMSSNLNKSRSPLNHWAQLQEKGGVIGIKTMLTIYLYLGRTPFNLILYPVVLYYFLSSAVARKSSQYFINRVRSKIVYQPGKKLWRLSFGHFLQFASGILDKLIGWMGAIQYQDVNFPDQASIMSLVESKQGALIIGSHLGNLEVMRALSSYNDKIRLNILVHTKHAEKFNHLLNHGDESRRLNMIQVTEINPATAISLKKRLAEGEFIVIMGDRIPVQESGSRQSLRTAVVDFLGSKALFSLGPYLVSSVLKCPVYTLFCVKENEKYTIKFDFFSDPIKTIRGKREESLLPQVQAYAQRLEQEVLKSPSQWYNFFPFWLEEF
jgi:predicted LPLAT superfamily acyltransferase